MRGQTEVYNAGTLYDSYQGPPFKFNISWRLHSFGIRSTLLNMAATATVDPALLSLDLDKYPTAKKLAERCYEFFDEVKNLSAPHCQSSVKV